MAAAQAQASSAHSLKSVPWRSRDALVVFLLPWVLLPIAVLVLLQLLSPYVPGITQYLAALSRNDPGATFGLVVVDAIGSMATIGYYLNKYHVGLQALGVRRFSFIRTLLYFGLILLSFTTLIALVYWLVQTIDPSFDATQAQTNEFTGHTSTLSLLALVIIPPFIEEPVFRGFMFPAFAKRYGVIIGAILSSALFGFAHLQGNISVYTFVLGLLLCWLYTRVGSIVPGIGLHMLNNYLAYMAMNHK